jgi:hypothetical protein
MSMNNKKIPKQDTLKHVRQAHFQQQSLACSVYTLCKLLVSVTRNNTLNSLTGHQEDSGVLGYDAVSLG